MVQSRNRTLDILLNAKLGEAAEKGIAVEILQADAPESLPLTDAELCALMMNLLDNAIRAASLWKNRSSVWILHQKDGFFVFVCENADTADAVEKRVKKRPCRSTVWD
ncbi:MAG: GHKL domain-containing protein [Lachnoclostridium sp.]